MWSKIFVLTQVILVVAQSITVPPVWPKQNADVLQTANVRLPIEHTNVQPKSFAIENFYTHLHSSPVAYRNHETHLPSTQYPIVAPKLQYRGPINQEVYIYHPQPTAADTNKNIQVANHKPSSYQIVNYDNQEKDVHAEPMSSNVRESGKYLKTPNHKPYAENVALVKKSDSVDEPDERRDAISEHEFPREVPTKPIYPGDGKWSDYRLRHTPYVANKKEDPSHSQDVEDEKRPDGYDTFEQGQEQFQQARHKYRHDLDRFPKKHKLNPSPSDDTESESMYDKPESEFVPQKLYAQVRRTESEQHLPKSAIDPEEEENAARLREVIKDSKIHTVYTEEGYEDSAYDHAGHEKHAENSEGHAQLAEEEEAKSPNERKSGARSKHSGSRRNGRGRNIEMRKVRDNKKGTDAQDADSASSDVESKTAATKLDELPIKNMKKVTLQTGDKESVDMEIYTEVKYVPGAPQKKHKFIKIIPSYKKHAVENKTESSMQKSLKRVKRYDRDDLSKRYVRKRPNYYWKKVKTSTTERPLLNMRRKFEAALKNHNSRTTSTENAPSEYSTPESIVTATTILSTTVTTTSTTPIPPVAPPIEAIFETGKVTAKSSNHSKPNPLKVKLRKYIVKRQKRFTIDHPNVDVDLKEFVDVKALPNPTPKPDLTFVKYPYYKSPITDEINKYSPLRYAEDMANIPRKSDDLSFYESRSHIRCPQIESNVDPIPDRIKEQENEESAEMDEEDKGQLRLTGLGDKIDCLKVKYFGENPLDSPLFQEDDIDEPISLLTMKNVKKDQKNKVKVSSDMDLVNNIYRKPKKYDTNVGINEKINVNDKNLAKLSPEKHHNIKNDLNTKQATLDQTHNVLNRTRKRELRVKILEPIIVLDEETFSTTTLNPIHRKSDAVLRPPYTLLEMMNRNVEKMKPKSIYDQIKILEQENDKSTVMSDKVLPLREKFLVIYDQEDVNHVTTEHALQKQIKMIQPAIGGYKSPKVSDIISDLTMYSRDIEQPEVINLLAETSTKTKPTVSSETVQKQVDPLKKTLAPVLRRISIRKPTENPKKISSRKLQRTTFKPDITTTRPSQTAKESSLQKSEIPQPTQASMIGLTTESSLPIKHPYVRSSFPYIFDISRYLPQVPNHRIITSEVHYKDEIKPSEQMRMYSDVLKTINDEIEISSVQPNVTIAKPTEQESAGSHVHDDRVVQNKEKNAQFSSTKSIIHNDHIPEASDKIVDLVPPSNGYPYRTVSENPVSYNGQPTFELQNAQSINYHYILGLKPPQPKKNTLKIYRKIIKRQIPSNAQSLKEVNHEMANEKIHNSTPFVHIGKGRLKRDTSDTGLDDLIAEESRTYEVTPSRKPKVYTEIVRAKSAITKKEEEDDSEDLNPRKRVYELKSTNSVSTENTINFEELIEDEIETQTEPATTPVPIIYPVEANSDNPSLAQYVFLIDRLHDKWERENPSTESIPEATSQMSSPKPTEAIQSVAESINVPAGEPAFLQIINQLHNVREDEDKKDPPSTTTAASVTVEEDTPSDPVKNSNPYLVDSIIPESFMSELSSMQAKLAPERSSDNQDESARLRNFSAKFKTSIDTSKYKTIDRNPVSFRHNLSSRYNADDQELPLSRVHTTQLPMIPTTASSQSDITTTRHPTEEVTIGNETTTSKADTEITVTTTARTRKPLRSRNRSTTTPKPTSVTSFRRRRPTRITTEATITTTKSDILQTRRRSRFRPESQNRSPVSQPRTRPVYTSTTQTPITEEAAKTDSPEDNKKQRRLQTIHERRVVSEVTLTRFYEPSSDESGTSSSNENVEESKRHQYQIAGPLASATELYSDPELAKHVNQLKDRQQSTSTERTPQLSSVNSEEIVGKLETSTNGVGNLYPNMARMINRLAESPSDSMASLNADASSEDDVESGSSMEDKPLFIKDPSKRMYYYARL